MDPSCSKNPSEGQESLLNETTPHLEPKSLFIPAIRDPVRRPSLLRQEASEQTLQNSDDILHNSDNLEAFWQMNYPSPSSNKSLRKVRSKTMNSAESSPFSSLHGSPGIKDFISSGLSVESSPISIPSKGNSFMNKIAINTERKYSMDSQSNLDEFEMQHSSSFPHTFADSLMRFDKSHLPLTIPRQLKRSISYQHRRLDLHKEISLDISPLSKLSGSKEHERKPRKNSLGFKADSPLSFSVDRPISPFSKDSVLYYGTSSVASSDGEEYKRTFRKKSLAESPLEFSSFTSSSPRNSIASSMYDSIAHFDLVNASNMENTNVFDWIKLDEIMHQMVEMKQKIDVELQRVLQMWTQTTGFILSNSWPPSTLNNLQCNTFKTIIDISEEILNCDLENMILYGSRHYVHKLRCMLSDEQTRIVVNVEAEERLTHLLLVLAPFSRLTELYLFYVHLEKSNEATSESRILASTPLSDARKSKSFVDLIKETSREDIQDNQSINSVYSGGSNGSLKQIESREWEDDPIFQEIDYEIELQEKEKQKMSAESHCKIEKTTSKSQGSLKPKISRFFNSFRGSVNNSTVTVDLNPAETQEESNESVSYCSSCSDPSGSSRDLSPLENVTCRICDECVPFHLFQEHSLSCAVGQEIAMRKSTCAIRLKRLDKIVSKYLRTFSSDPTLHERIKIIETLLFVIRKALDLSEELETSSAESYKLLKKLDGCMSRKYFQDKFTKLFASRIRHVVQEKADICMVYKGKYQKARASSIQNLAMFRRRSSGSSVSSSINGTTDSEVSSSKSRNIISLFSAILKRGHKKQPVSINATPTNDVKLKTELTIKDFEIVKPISKGAFGRVFLAKKRATNDLFAIKVIRKSDMIRKNMVTHVLAERRVMALSKTPFVVKLYFAFQSKEYLYLVMEYLIGGDLSSLLQATGYLEEPIAKFYIAEAIAALEYLHSNSIIHRDIKPDNMLIDQCGHLKLTDFGLSKIMVNEDMEKVSSKSATLLNESTNPVLSRTPSKKALNRAVLGTPDYLAPELLLGLDHTPAVDWWALGICLFEFLVGYPPFTDSSPEKIFRNILNNQIEWDSPDLEHLTENAKSILKRLLESNPEQRPSVAELKRHPFFEGIEWDYLRSQPAPFIPNTTDQTDTSYFDMRNSRLPPCDQNISDSVQNLQVDMNNCDLEAEKEEEEEDKTMTKDDSFESFSYKNINLLENINQRMTESIKKTLE